GGREKYFGTNPISFAFPRANGEPICLDMATSQVAWNKVLNARIEGEALDPGVAVDEKGEPTTDAHQARAAIPLGGPIYGYKGYGLAFMIDLLCGAMNGMSFGPYINSMYEELDKPRKIGHLAVATSGTKGIDDATLAKLPNLKMISHFGVGVDSIDTEAVKRRGVMLSNTPDVLTDDVADIAIGLLIAVSRKLVVGDRYVREGKWLKGPMPLAESVQGKTLGIVGMGRIGR